MAKKNKGKNKKKKDRGRPLKNNYPPRIDATPEELVRSFFAVPASKGDDMKAKEVYHCSDCGRAVHYPETLYEGNLCQECHVATRV